jgi:hypothetical protein
MLRCVKILHGTPKEKARKTFCLFLLFHRNIQIILFTRPLRRLCLPILVHNLCCCYSGKRKVHKDVYPSTSEFKHQWTYMANGISMRKKDTFLTSPRNPLPQKNCEKGGEMSGKYFLPDGRHFKNFLEGAPKNRFPLSNVDHVFTLCE